MRFSIRTKIILMGLLTLLNIILRFQVESHEIGSDTFLIHIMANSVNEFGYAKWFLHPLSIFGLYPASYTSAVQFFLSGISQSTGMEMRWAIFLYCVFIGVLSMFTAYLMAGEIMDNDIFKFLVAFGFSACPAVVGYTTWTMATRNLLVVLAPLLIYLLLKCRTSVKYVPLTILLAIFLLATHHLSYFIIPAFFAFFILTVYFKLKKHINIKIPEKIAAIVPMSGLVPFFAIAGFIFMYSIPFVTGRFIEHSRYASIDINYVRYMGILIIFAIGGLAYLVFKLNKDFREWFLLLTLILLTVFIYEQTYMKWFLPIFVIPLAGIGLINVLRTSEKRKYVVPIVTIVLVLAVCFTAYFQFLHTYKYSSYNGRCVEESTYMTGRWMKDNIDGTAISNDVLRGNRIFAASETTHFLVPYTLISPIYGFIHINISECERYSITDEEFWFSGYEARDVGEKTWEQVHNMQIPRHEFNITYMVENRKCRGTINWLHSNKPVKLLKFAYEKDCIYNNGAIYIWYL